MAQSEETGFKSFKADGAIAQHLRVKVGAAAGQVDVAGIADRDIGTAMNAAFAAGDVVRVKLASAPGTVKMVAAEALAAGALVYTDATGLIQDTSTSTGFHLGIALTAATAASDVVEVLRVTHGGLAIA